jgi:type III secretion protein K
MQHSPLLQPNVLAFNFLPSHTLHPSQWMQFDAAPFLQALEAMPAQAHLWHRHWSRHILRQTGLGQRWITDLTDPMLPLALLPPQALAAHARKLGVVLYRPRLRGVIAGHDVRALQAALGPAFRWVYEQDVPHDGFLGPEFEGPDDAVVIVDSLGWATLRAGFGMTDVAIAGRALLKLPAAASSLCPLGDENQLTGHEAMTLSLQLLNR